MSAPEPTLTYARPPEHVQAEELAVEIVTRRNRRFEEQASRSIQQTSIWASDLHPCDRYQYLNITRWKDKPPWTARNAMRFEVGKTIERRVNIELLDMGYEVEAQQERLVLADRKGRPALTGKIDGKIRLERARFPYETKSVDDWLLDKLTSARDFLTLEQDYLRKYPIQLATYLYGTSTPAGLFIIVSLKGRWKALPLFLDDYWQEIENVLQQGERVLDAVANEQEPPYYTDPDICQACRWYGRACNPPLERNPNLALIRQDEVLAKLRRRDELEAAAEEYEQLDKDVKRDLKEIPSALLGEFLINGKWVGRTVYDMSEDLKRTCGRIDPQGGGWRMTIRRLTPSGEGGSA